jgi:hypothetical protein
VHLVFNFPGVKWGVGRTLCGEPITTIAKEGVGGSTDDFEIITMNLTVNEIIRAVAKDDKDELCNKCLAEFFDKVLPLKWELMKKEAAAEKEKKARSKKKNKATRGSGKVGDGS